MFSGADAPWHWFILAIVVVVLFGYKKLPEAARSLGRSLRIFKTEMKGMTDDDEARAASKAEIVPPSQPAAPAETVAQPPAQVPSASAPAAPTTSAPNAPTPTTEPGTSAGG
jgi:sec-independent protein translocase protein TatA